MAIASVLPRPVGFQDPAVEQWANRLVDVVQKSLDDLSNPATGGFAISGNTTRTTLNPTTDTLTQGLNSLATLIVALKQAGKIT